MGFKSPAISRILKRTNGVKKREQSTQQLNIRRMTDNPGDDTRSCEYVINITFMSA